MESAFLQDNCSVLALDISPYEDLCSFSARAPFPCLRTAYSPSRPPLPRPRSYSMKVFHIAALALSATTAAAAVKKAKATTECSHTTCVMESRSTAIGVHDVMVSFGSARRLAACHLARPR